MWCCWTSVEGGVVAFNVKLTNVDQSSAEFEILDDNTTTINYKIAYTLMSNHSASVSHGGASEPSDKTLVLKSSFDMQTNSLGMLVQQELIDADDDSIQALIESNKARDNGEIYSGEDKARIRSKSYEELHRFLLPDLEPNREYEVSLSIQAREAYLNSLLTGVQKPDSEAVVRQFQFKFKTTFDYDLAASLACNNSMPELTVPGNKINMEASSSCYVRDTNCTRCGLTCYQVRPYRNPLNNPKPTKSSKFQVK